MKVFPMMLLTIIGVSSGQTASYTPDYVANYNYNDMSEVVP